MQTPAFLSILRFGLFLSPDSVYLNYRLGRNLAKLGRETEAIIYYKKAISLNPTLMSRHSHKVLPVFVSQEDWGGLVDFSTFVTQFGLLDNWSFLFTGSPAKDELSWQPRNCKFRGKPIGIIISRRLDLDCLGSIIEHIKDSDDFLPVIYFCASTDLEHDRNLFQTIKKYGVPVKAFSFSQFFIDRPIYTFVAQPWFPPFFYEIIASSGSKFIYIPYGSSISGEHDSAQLQYISRIHDLAWKIYVISDFHKQQYVANNEETRGRNVEAIRTCPKFDAIRPHRRYTKEKKEIRSFLWNIHFYMDAGKPDLPRTWSAFYSYYQAIYSFFKEHPHLSLIIRPHPLLYSTAYNANFFEALKIFDDCPNVCQDKSAETGYDADLTADAFITDRSSMIFDFLVLGRPIVILSYHNSARFNEYAASLFGEYTYQTSTVEELNLVLSDLVDGIDPLEEKRASLAETDKVFLLSRPAAHIIVTALTSEPMQQIEADGEITAVG